MIEKEEPKETERYGAAPWIVGLVLGVVIVTLMFMFSAGFT